MTPNSICHKLPMAYGPIRPDLPKNWKSLGPCLSVYAEFEWNIFMLEADRTMRKGWQQLF